MGARLTSPVSVPLSISMERGTTGGEVIKNGEDSNILAARNI